MLVFAVLGKIIFRFGRNGLFGNTSLRVNGIPADKPVSGVGHGRNAYEIVQTEIPEGLRNAAFRHDGFMEAIHLQPSVPLKFQGEVGVLFRNGNAKPAGVLMIVQHNIVVYVINTFFSEVQPVVINGIIAEIKRHKLRAFAVSRAAKSHHLYVQQVDFRCAGFVKQFLGQIAVFSGGDIRGTGEQAKLIYPFHVRCG